MKFLSQTITLFGLFWCLCLANAKGQAPGSLDFDFGQNGIQRLNVDHSDYVSAIETDAIGNIYVLGSATHYGFEADLDYVVAKLDPYGQADLSFGTNGLIRGDFGPFKNTRVVDGVVSDQALYILAEANNAGPQDTQRVYVGKIDLESGQFDPDFAENGLFSRTFVGEYATAGEIKVLPDGKILFCGMTTDTNVWHIEMPLVGRLLENGRPDSTFGDTGFITWSLRNGLASARTLHNDGGQFMTVLPLANSYLLGGFFFTSNVSKVMMMMVDGSGNLCDGFGDDGLMFPELSPGFNCGIVGSCKRGDNIYLATQVSVWQQGEDMALLSMDSTGANLNIAQLDFYAHEDRIQDIQIDHNGQIVVAGYARALTSTALGHESDGFAVAALNAPNQLSGNFGDQGRMLMQLNPGFQSGANAICETPDGKLLVAGFVEDTTNGNFSDIVVMRLWNDAALEAVQHNELNLRLFPNPSTDRIFVEGMHRGKAKVFDAQGTVVKENVSIMDGIDVSNLATGMYVVEVGGKRGRFMKL